MKSLFSFLLIVFTLSACQTSFKPQQGDLLFQDLDCGATCDAIEKVTEGALNKNISHIGVVVIENNERFVLEAIPPKVKLTPIDSFLNRSVDENGNPKVMVGRIYSRDVKFMQRALYTAKNKVGITYDDAFIYRNGKYYCSELIYDVFKSANYGRAFFELQPMTFKAPRDTAFMPAWAAYYAELEQEIPEGQPGINPALISQSEHLKIIHHYGMLSEK